MSYIRKEIEKLCREKRKGLRYDNSDEAFVKDVKAQIRAWEAVRCRNEV